MRMTRRGRPASEQLAVGSLLGSDSGRALAGHGLLKELGEGAGPGRGVLGETGEQVALVVDSSGSAVAGWPGESR
jgi:hypothetical protein